VADRSVALTTIRGGINRQRTKGGAPQDSLYDLVNGYVSKSKTIIVRPGTARVYELPVDTAGDNETQGLMAFEGALHVFSDREVTVPSGIVLHVITHPDATADAPIRITEINFAAPFMGFPYVVATFDNDDTLHFWLQDGDEWEADHAYKLGDIVVPTTANGFAYQAGRLLPANTSWAPDVLRSVGDVVEPTVYNDFLYTVVDTQGANPRSGSTEPVWPTTDGAQINEDADGSASVPPSVTEPPDVAALPAPGIRDRYSNGPRSS
jgi:hypothetical protein